MKNYKDMTDEELVIYIDDSMEWDIDALEELVKRADLWDEEILEDYNRDVSPYEGMDADYFFQRAKRALLGEKE